MKPVRVLYINGGKLDYGGVTSVMLNYASRFDPNEVIVDFLVHGEEKGPREAEALALGGRVIHVPHKVPHYFANRRAILAALRNGRYDIVHAHMDGMNGYVLALAKKAGIPHRISHCHNTQFLTNDPLRVLLHRRTADRIPRVATQLFACSEAAGRFLYGDALCAAGRVRVIPNAIELSRFRFDARSRAAVRADLAIADDRFVIGHIGRFDHQKNQEFLLPLLAEVRKTNDKAMLVLLGDGAARAELTETAGAMGLGEHVRFAGFREDVPAMLSAFDLFVLPSRFEGLGIVLIEAQASGLKCIASTDVPKDTCITDCRYVPLADPQAWARAVLEPPIKTERTRAVDLAPFVKARYDIDTEAERLCSLYREIVSAEAPARKKRVLFITNIPAPYRIDFFDMLGQRCDLTVLFEARRASGIRFNWNDDGTHSFRAVFLRDGEIDETHVDRRIFRYIRRGLYDHIVATSYGYYTETAALLRMRLSGIPYDLELDGGVVRSGEPLPKRLLKRFIIRGAKRLFSSGASTDALFTHYGADKARLVRYPFTSVFARDLPAAAPDADEKRALRAALFIPYGKVLLAVGQFIHRKGFDVLLSACDRFGADAGVYIVGGEPTEEYLSIVREKRLTNVHFLPFMDGAALARWFAAADVFVLPTREDMWGLVVNEAMAHGLPVITTDRCNAGVELVENGVNGYLVPAENADALACRTLAILGDDHLRARMAAASLDRMRSYTIEHMVEAHVDAFGAE